MAVGEAVLSRQSSQVRASLIRNSRFSRKAKFWATRAKCVAISARQQCEEDANTENSRFLSLSTGICRPQTVFGGLRPPPGSSRERRWIRGCEAPPPPARAPNGASIAANPPGHMSPQVIASLGALGRSRRIGSVLENYASPGRRPPVTLRSATLHCSRPAVCSKNRMRRVQGGVGIRRGSAPLAHRSAS
jgi:hypothetical protein